MQNNHNFDRPIVAIGFPPQEVSLGAAQPQTPEWELQLLQRLGSSETSQEIGNKSRSSFRNRLQNPRDGLTPKDSVSQKSSNVNESESSNKQSRFERVTNDLEKEEIITGMPQSSEFQNEANIPGAAGVIRTLGGHGFYCTVCKKILVDPILYEVDGEEIPCCEDCALEEMTLEGQEIRTPEAIDPVGDAIGEHDIAEDVIWESMT
jgi:hypothetical protein